MQNFTFKGPKMTLDDGYRVVNLDEGPGYSSATKNLSVSNLTLMESAHFGNARMFQTLGRVSDSIVIEKVRVNGSTFSDPSGA